MIRENKFVLSRKPYAVDLSSLKAGEDMATVVAVWFRRRRPRSAPSVGPVTVACIGQLWDIQRPRPATAAEFLDRLTDGRYGGTCWARWDGSSLWTTATLEVAERALGVLRPMLANYPEIPPGYDGWWRF